MRVGKQFFAWLASEPNWNGIDGAMHQRLEQFAVYAADPMNNCDSHFRLTLLEQHLRNNGTTDPRKEVAQWIQRRIIVPYVGEARCLCFWSQEFQVRLITQRYLRQLGDPLLEETSARGSAGEAPITQRQALLLELVDLSTHAIYMDVLCSLIHRMDGPVDLLQLFIPAYRSDAEDLYSLVKNGRTLLAKCAAIQPSLRAVLENEWQTWESAKGRVKGSGPIDSFDPNRDQQTWIAETLHTHFSLTDLEILCMRLEVVWEDLPGDRLEIKAWRLADHCKRISRSHALLELICKQRPKVCETEEYLLLFSEVTINH